MVVMKQMDGRTGERAARGETSESDLPLCTWMCTDGAPRLTFDGQTSEGKLRTCRLLMTFIRRIQCFSIFWTFSSRITVFILLELRVRSSFLANSDFVY